MKRKKILKNKNGFSLMECVIALLLFSIIVASVLTMFSSSRNQIKRQNDQYKVELMASNILAAYEGSNTSTSFSNRLGNLGLELNTSGTYNRTIGSEGHGQYSFDAQNIPVAIPFSKIVVKDGEAVFKNESGNSDLVSFEGTYPDNKLQSNEDYGWNPSELYDEEEITALESITLTGTARPLISFKPNSHFEYTITMTESKVKMTYGDFSEEQESSSFDRYLLKNAYFLKCVGGYSPSLLNITDSGYYYFQVYDAITKNAVKVDGKNLYYYIHYNMPYFTCSAQLATLADDDNVAGSYYFDLSGCTIKYLVSSSLQENADAYTELTDEDGNAFNEGKWYFFPWLAFRKIEDFTPICSNYEIDCVYHEYRTKTNLMSNIYYVLDSSRNSELLMFNSDKELIFPIHSDYSKTPLQNLISNCGFGINGKRNTQGVYNGMTYDKWYKKGAVPLWQVTKVKFTDGGESNSSKIVFYGKAADAEAESDYITFNYSKEDYDKFKEDRKTITDYSGEYADLYNYTKTYTTTVNDITDESTINEWESVGSIASKLGEKFYKDTKTKTIAFYTLSSSKYKYYTYTATLSPHNEISKLDIEKNVAVTHNGTEFSFSGMETATASFDKVYQASSVAYKTKSTSGTRTKPSADVLQSVSDYSKYTNLTSSGKAKALEDAKASIDLCVSAANGTASDSKSMSTVGYNIDTVADWACTEPTEADLHTVAELSSFIKNDDSFEVQIAERTAFIAHPSDFSITAGDISTDNSDCIYDVIGGESADIRSETYCITWNAGDTSLVSIVTYSNYTKEFEVDGEIQNQEPKIAIWSMPKDKVPSDIKTVTDSSYDKYLYRVYRKG